MVLWIGVDDTDSLRGMCTTFLATELVRELMADHDIIGYPRLVRLNPSIPWKTRGNGAVCLRVGKGSGAPFPIGSLDGQVVRGYPRGVATGDEDALLRRVSEVLERYAAFDDPTTNPGAVVLRSRPPPSLYWDAVREVVELSRVVAMLPRLGVYHGYKNARGLIGATAATAWRPRDRTYEMLCYRASHLWGTRRLLEGDSVRAMDAAFEGTFNNLDASTGHVAIAPHSPCPVLYGIRGDAPEYLREAQSVLRGEPPERWLLFETNQGTDDHIRWDDWTLRPGSSTSISGSVAGLPRTVAGGHTFVAVRGPRVIDLAFYEPSKDFRRLARNLRPGDRVRAWGSVRADGRSLNVEKIELATLSPWRVRSANPRCPQCGKSMKSMGAEKGFRCARGHGKASPAAADYVQMPRTLGPGVYEPPAYARRHLAMPVQRMARPSSTASRTRPRALARRALSTAS